MHALTGLGVACGKSRFSTLFVGILFDHMGGRPDRWLWIPRRTGQGRPSRGSRGAVPKVLWRVFGSKRRV
eukprot:4339535-Lingulodinium_polyedra.AAC.1